MTPTPPFTDRHVWFTTFLWSSIKVKIYLYFFSCWKLIIFNCECSLEFSYLLAELFCRENEGNFKNESSFKIEKRGYLRDRGCQPRIYLFLNGVASANSCWLMFQTFYTNFIENILKVIFPVKLYPPAKEMCLNLS